MPIEPLHTLRNNHNNLLVQVDERQIAGCVHKHNAPVAEQKKKNKKKTP